MTEKIYESDAYCRTFLAKVISCEILDDGWAVALNQTAFFPEGGGQASDGGTINGLCVTEVWSDGDKIYHKIASEIKAGEEVSCEIDWELRYSRMQSHTGEHILSGLVHSEFGYDNVGFHMSEYSMQVDFSGSLSKEDIDKIELLANKAVYNNLDIVAYYPTKEELDRLQFRSKKEFESDVRIVKIQDVDCCACCAPHLAKTGEVGLIKVVDFCAYKQGTRIELVAGINALKDYVSQNILTKTLMSVLSTPRANIVQAVEERMKNLQDLRYENQLLSRKVALYELQRVEVGDSVYGISDNLGYDELRYCSNSMLEQGYQMCILLSKNEDSYIYVVNSESKDIRDIVKQLNESFQGKGGGKNNYAQGKLMGFPEEDIKSMLVKILTA